MKFKISAMLAIFVVLFFAGCAKTPINSGVVRTSQPIFISKIPAQKLVSVNFTNTSTMDSNLTQAVSDYLRKDGFAVVSEDKANVKVGGNLNYFRHSSYRNGAWGRPRFHVGFGFGHGFRRGGLGMGFPFFYDPWDDDDYYEDYFYDGQVGLLISVKDGEAWSDYATNLDYQSSTNPGSKSRVIDAFNYKIYEIIKQFLSNEDVNKRK